MSRDAKTVFSARNDHAQALLVLRRRRKPTVGPGAHDARIAAQVRSGLPWPSAPARTGLPHVGDGREGELSIRPCAHGFASSKPLNKPLDHGLDVYSVLGKTVRAECEASPLRFAVSTGPITCRSPPQPSAEGFSAVADPACVGSESHWTGGAAGYSSLPPANPLRVILAPHRVLLEVIRAAEAADEGVTEPPVAQAAPGANQAHGAPIRPAGAPSPAWTAGSASGTAGGDSWGGCGDACADGVSRYARAAASFSRPNMAFMPSWHLAHKHPIVCGTSNVAHPSHRHSGLSCGRFTTP
jgi:hypothetical protein